MGRAAGKLYALVALAGCGRLGFAAEPDASGPAADAHVDAAADAMIDLACDPRTPAETVALFTFDGAAPVADATGVHDGVAHGGAAPTNGRCGTALGLAAAGDYALVPDSPAFDLAAGAIDLYARIDSLGGTRGLLSRDANGTPVSGHFSLAVTPGGIVWVRMQTVGNAMFFRCSDVAVTPGQWTHIAVSFGPPGLSLWIDHALQTARATEDTNLDGTPESCTTPHTGGIAGPDDAWTIGALLWMAVEGAPDPLPEAFLAGGAIDHVRIRDAWTDFATL